ncbi:hypothetical protein [Mesomycoplasma hyorhinis]|uniref:hypothetical protein n=1 Tax=Mesomycoplasma hyorhinis TaxID=2100 RepID=UPI001C04F9FE|nr:hypothetical protein [Mesomycoplasma hyorhinis]
MFFKKLKILLASTGAITTGALLFSCQNNQNSEVLELENNLTKQKLLDQIIQIPLFIEGEDVVKVKDNQGKDLYINLLDYSLYYYLKQLEQQNIFEKGIRNKDIVPNSKEPNPTIKDENNNDVLYGYNYHGISELKASDFLAKWKKNQAKNNIWYLKYGDGFYINNPFFKKYNLFSRIFGWNQDPKVEQSVGSLGTFWWNIDYSKLVPLVFDANFQRKKDLLAQLDKFTVTKEKEVYNFDADKKVKQNQQFRVQLRASFEFDKDTIADDQNHELKNIIFKLYWIQDPENGINYPDDSRFSYSGLYSEPISQIKKNPKILFAQRRINVKGFIGIDFQAEINKYEESLVKEKIKQNQENSSVNNNTN